jgi:hypothetical protein
MAVYQIPQFLDSGDKILGPMNLRQFGYALGAFFICAGLFAGLGNVITPAGATVVISPVASIGAYLALGKFNGRDAEIYVLKIILYLNKPRTMIYTRKPYIEDLEKRMSEWTWSKIEARWKEDLNRELEIRSNKFSTFREVSSEEKAEKVRLLGNALDSSLVNTLNTVRQKSISNQAKRALVYTQTHQPTNPQNPAQNKNSLPPRPATHPLPPIK